jgi:hypothetical protein
MDAVRAARASGHLAPWRSTLVISITKLAGAGGCSSPVSTFYRRVDPLRHVDPLR